MPKAKLKAKTKRRRPARPPAQPTLPMGAIAGELAKILGRGALVNCPGESAFYLPVANLSGGAKALAVAYKPFEQWVLLDASTEIAMSTALPLTTDLPRLAVWEGATPASVAEFIVRHNQEIAARAMRCW